MKILVADAFIFSRCLGAPRGPLGAPRSNFISVSFLETEIRIIIIIIRITILIIIIIISIEGETDIYSYSFLLFVCLGFALCFFSGFSTGR